MLAWFFTLNTRVAQREREADEQETLATQVAQIESEAESIRTQVQPIMNKKDYVEAVRFYNTLTPKIFRRVAAYTIRDVEYNQLSLNGDALSISAYAKNIGDVGRYLITMFGNPDLKAVSVSGIPAGLPATRRAAGAAFRPGGGGGFPGGGAGGGYPGIGGGGFPGGGGGFPGAGGAGGQAPARPGFPFNVTATLVQPVAPPQIPSEGAEVARVPAVASRAVGEVSPAAAGGGYPGGGGYPAAGAVSRAVAVIPAGVGIRAPAGRHQLGKENLNGSLAKITRSRSPSSRGAYRGGRGRRLFRLDQPAFGAPKGCRREVRHEQTESRYPAPGGGAQTGGRGRGPVGEGTMEPLRASTHAADQPEQSADAIQQRGKSSRWCSGR
jgi:hypothetical protein